MNGFFENILSFSEGSNALRLEGILLSVLCAFICSQLVAWFYIWTHRGLTYSASVAQSLIVLALVVCFVMLVVGNDLARAFGMFGALALIRFRTPVKDSWDTVFLFLSVAIGIACGTQNLMAAVVGTVTICLVIGYLALTRFGTQRKHDGLLRVRLPMGGEQEGVLRRLMKRYCHSFHLIHIREATRSSDGPRLMEYAWQVKLVDSSFGAQLMAELAGIEGASTPALLMQDEEIQP